jgi:hypothetical protein
MTPFATPDRHFLGNGGIWLHLTMAGNYPRIPGVTLGLGLVHYPLLPVTHQSALLVQSGWSAPPPRRRDGATDNMSQFRWHHLRQRRVLLKRPAGLSITVDDPTGRSHHPRAFAPSCQQRYEGIVDGPMQFAFANPLRLPSQDIVALFVDAVA